MRLVTDPKLIKRNAFIGKYGMLAGLAILIGGLIFSLRIQPGDRAELQLIPFVTLIVGFLFSNIGSYFANRWVRPPRPDEALDAALKGLDDRHVLYHYRLPAAHVLVAPSGVYALLPKRQGGAITYTGGKWRQAGAARFLAFFGQEGLGNPIADLAYEIDKVTKFLAKRLPEASVPVQGIVVFFDPGAVLQVEDAALPVMHAKQLKDHIRRQPKGPTLSREMVAQLDSMLKVETAADTAKS